VKLLSRTSAYFLYEVTEEVYRAVHELLYGPWLGWISRNYPFRGHKALIWEGGMRVRWVL
jgi:hypothetical protein